MGSKHMVGEGGEREAGLFVSCGAGRFEEAKVV